MVSDFHTHILPGIDDGSASVEESIAMLKAMAQQGITRVVATPHFYPRHDSPQRFLARREEAERALRKEMQRHEGLPEVIVGAEVHYYRGISESDVLSGLTIGDKCGILIEMPMAQWSEAMYRDLAAIPEKQGLVPIIAHVDRYFPTLGDGGIPAKLAELPVYVQANASAFLRFSTRGRMLRLLREEKVHFLGSDCHNLTDRAPNLVDAVRVVEKHHGASALQRICSYEDRVL